MMITHETWPPMNIGHRGFSATYPENTRSAFAAALRAGARGIETDIQMSQDEHLMIYHDTTLSKIGGGLKRIRSSHSDWLATLDAGNGEEVMTLDGLLEELGGRCLLMLEIKPREKNPMRFNLTMDRVIESVRGFGLVDSVMVLCFDLDLLRYGYSKAPELRYVWNQDVSEYNPDADFLYAYSVNIKGLYPDVAAQIKQQGKALLTWTVNDQKPLTRALQCGVNGIMSDDPAWLQGYLQAFSGSEV